MTRGPCTDKQKLGPRHMYAALWPGVAASHEAEAQRGGYDRRVSHPDASARPDLRPIEPGEVWENPVTGERAVVLEMPWHNTDGRTVAELTALPGARVMGEHLHPRCMSTSACLRAI